jgi:phage tail sheath protein FI
LAGADGNNITIEATKNSGNDTSDTSGGTGILDIVIKYKGVTKETYVGLTFANATGDTSATIKINDAVSGSQYITVSSQVTNNHASGEQFNTSFATAVTFTLTGGATGGQSEKATGNVQGATAGVAANHFLLTAENEGAWADGLTADITAGLEAASTTTYGTFDMVIKLDGGEKERWTEVSLDATHNRYVLTLLNNYSDYVRVSNVATPTKAANTSVTSGTYSLVGGSDGTAVLASDYTTALAYLDQVTGDLLINLPGVSSSSEVNSALAYASTRGTGFVVIDPDPTATTAAAAVTVVSPYSNSGYGAVYYPAVTAADPTKTGPASLRTSAVGGAVMAIYAKAERLKSVAQAPAGFNYDLANVFGLIATYTEAEEGTLYSSGINPIRLVPGTGAILNGTRTLAVTSPERYIPIRRTLNFVKARMKEITKFAVFEPNDANLREQVTEVVTQELRGLWGKGGLKGGTSDLAFYVTCDGTNNTSTTVANGEIHVEVGLALQYPAEFVIINVSQWTGGSNAVDTL